MAILLIITMPVTIWIVGLALPRQMGETYYGELPYMFDRLRKTKGKKIVLIGNSSVAFGVRSDLLQAELPDYTVVNFGLYGAVGTKTMIDLSKVNISQGDIVVVLPEAYPQSSSLYFSARDTWRAIEGNSKMFRYIAKENRSAMVGAYPAYVQEKYAYYTGAKNPSAEGVYSQRAFLDEQGQEVGYMTYPRAYNVMSGGYDPTYELLPAQDTFQADFLAYVNNYNRYVQKKGATLYWGFTPLNQLVLAGTDEQTAQDQFDFLESKLDFEVLGYPLKYFLDHHWFYDNNVHMNSAGMYVYTDLLAEDLKLKLGVTTPNQITIPDMPQIPLGQIGQGDNSDANLFTYEVMGSGDSRFVRLTGLTEEGKKRTELTLPTDYDGVIVKELAQNVFKGNTTISKITLPQTIGTIYDRSFEGANRLSQLVFQHDSILGLNIGTNFLAGADRCLIYVKKGVNLVDCAGGWEQYQSRIRYY